MKTQNLFKTVIILALAVFLSSCEKDDGNTNGKIFFKVNTTSSSTVNLQQSKAAANDLVFTSGTIIIREIVFDGEVGLTSVSRTIEQIANIDYATGVVSPEVVIEIPAGDYTGVNLGIELQDENADPSVVIEGTYTNSSGVATPIRFEFNSGEVFEADAASVTIKPGADLIGKITFDAVSWFSVVTAEEMDNATLTDGKIIISSTNNADIFDLVADKLDVDTEAVFE